jgi:hypothetical protein
MFAPLKVPDKPLVMVTQYISSAPSKAFNHASIEGQAVYERSL